MLLRSHRNKTLFFSLIPLDCLSNTVLQNWITAFNGACRDWYLSNSCVKVQNLVWVQSPKSSSTLPSFSVCTKAAEQASGVCLTTISQWSSDKLWVVRVIFECLLVGFPTRWSNWDTKKYLTDLSNKSISVRTWNFLCDKVTSGLTVKLHVVSNT